MESYKVAVVTPSMDGYLDLWTAYGERIPMFLPTEYAHMVRRGTRVMLYRGRSGAVMAYSFGDNVIFGNPVSTSDAIRDFIGDFKSICGISFDKMLFEYSLRRNLSKMGMIPTRNLALDIQSYNYAHHVGR